MFNNFKPKDAIAVLIIIGVIAMKIKGVNGGLDTAGALIVGYYFGHRTTKIDNG